MNLRQFSIALLISALPSTGLAQSNMKFNHGDFVAKEKKNQEGERMLQVKLSKSGKAKLKKSISHLNNLSN